MHRMRARPDWVDLRFPPIYFRTSSRNVSGAVLELVECVLRIRSPRNQSHPIIGVRTRQPRVSDVQQPAIPPLAEEHPRYGRPHVMVRTSRSVLHKYLKGVVELSG